MLHAARWKYNTQKSRQKLPSGYHRTTLSGYIFATKACIDNRKKYVKQQCLLRMLSSYTNFPYRLFVRINPLPSKSRLRCCDRYIRCHRLLAVKPLSPRQHAGRRVGMGLLAAYTDTAVLIRPATYDNGLLLAVRDDSKLMYAWCQLIQ